MSFLHGIQTGNVLLVMPAVFPVFFIDFLNVLCDIRSDYRKNVIIHFILIHKLCRMSDPGISIVAGFVMSVGIMDLFCSVNGKPYEKMMFL